MKSRTLSCEQTVLYKDITRFAPSWILYSVFLLLLFMLCRQYEPLYTASHLADTGNFLAIINFIYGLINAQLLFGDLFRSRMTNALHALPLRRESWFGCHILAGIAFSLIPNLLFTAAMLLVCSQVPNLPGLWLLTATGQYVFFFALGVLCMCVVGNRFAGVVLYGLSNFGSLLIQWLLDKLYIPLLPTVVLSTANFSEFCPVVWATGNIPYYANIGKIEQTVTIRPEAMVYLGMMALVGLGLLGLSLALYRVRQLETAGDFLAMPWLKAPFLVLHSLMMGMLCQAILGSITGSEWTYLIIGILIGYFTGQMLLMRTIKILSKKTFLGLGILLGGLALSMAVTAMDPLGIKAWIPDTEQVGSVSLNNKETRNPELVQQIVDLHEDLVQSAEYQDFNRYSANVRISYTLKDGSHVSREYMLYSVSQQTTMRKILSSPEYVFGELLDTWEDVWLRTSIEDPQGKGIILSRESWLELKEVLLLDCEAGTMHGGALYNTTMVYRFSIRVRVPDNGDNYYRYFYISIYEDSVNTLAWLKEQVFYQQYTSEYEK